MHFIQRAAIVFLLLLAPRTLAWQAAPAPGGPIVVTLPGKPDSVRFVAIGDMGTGEMEQYQVAARMEEFRRKLPYTFVLTLGDNIYGGKSAADLMKKFEIPYKLLLDAGVLFYATLGNHDDTNERFYKWFNMNGKQYYAFTKGNVRFFALDTNYLDPKQLAWLEQELAAATEPWKICYFHHPLYSSGGYHGSATELRKVLEPLFVKYGVQAVFAGHEHVYERVKAQKGIYYFTEGAAGELRAGDLRQKGLTEIGFDKDRSFLTIEISGDDLYYQAVSRMGVTVDSGIIRRPGAPPPDPR